MDIQKIAKLARLQLEVEEEERLQKKFEMIKSYIDSLSEVDTQNIHCEKEESFQQIYHEDIPKNSGISLTDFSPYIESNYIKVPKVIE